jgi:clan AA aspartic protease (TIGR02281 family)
MGPARSQLRKWLVVLLVAALELQVAHSAKADSIALINQGGVYAVPVVINSKITLNFIIDSGAADVTIPGDVVRTLMRTGTITKADFLGTKTYVLADGTEMPSRRIRIRRLQVGSLTLRDVPAAVGPLEGSLLLGQSFLGQLQTWTVNNHAHVLVFNEGSTANPSESSGAPPATTEPDDPLIGTWTSTGTSASVNYFDTHKWRRESRTFAMTPSGLSFTATWSVELSVVPTQRAALLDGKDYYWIEPNQTVAFTRIDQRTVEGLLKVGGKVVGMTRVVVSESGTTMSIDTNGPSCEVIWCIKEEYKKTTDER